MNILIQNKAVILDTLRSPYARLKPVSIGNVSLEGGFWQSRFRLNQDVTIPTQFQLLEKTGRLDNFRRVSSEINKPYQGYVFNDSDVYKWLEAASWTMIYQHDGNLHKLVDQVIKLILKAQDKDGYLNTYYSLNKSNERWTNLQEKHELYCAGHLIQAAIAHFRVTGENKLMNVAIRLADHIQSTFGPSGREGTSGHPEIEMALVELYRSTGEAKYLEQATLFIDRRGRGLLDGREYLLDHIPLRELDHLTGHAVRALYLCSGATDLILETGEQPLRATLDRLWTKMVYQQVYITGGVGARYDGEAFGEPYELPNARAYAETCAAITSVMWTWRMLQLEGNPRYADLLEWTLYNAVLPGISLDAKAYFYVNPLKDNGDHRRQAWFDCACCPPNLSRTIAMFPGYMYSVSDEGIWLHLYAQSKVIIELLTGQRVELQQTTNYPWDGKVTLQISDFLPLNSTEGSSRNANKFSIFLRLPGWLANQQVGVIINGERYRHHTAPGSYLEIHRNWQLGDWVSLDLPMDIRFIESHPSVEENIGRIAITRGPLVYCLEAVDNPKVLLSEIWVNPSIQPAYEFVPDFLGGIMQLHLMGKIRPVDQNWNNRLYQPVHLNKSRDDCCEIEILSIPYYSWANREPGAMEIWHLVN
ncbi:MAG: beta-L-arabinofuranosidase domain-containing protein [Anaerolineales bacterium]